MKNSPNNEEKIEELQRAAAAARLKHLQYADINEPLSIDDARLMLQDLRVHQIEVVMQNEELRKTQVDLDAARARYFDLYDLAPVGYFTVSEQGLIQEANLTAATLLGVSREKLLFKPLAGFIIKEDQDVHCLHRKKVLETGSTLSCDLRMARNDGSRFWAQLTTAVSQSDEANLLRVAVSDISERKRIEQEWQRSEERWRSITENPFDFVVIIDRDYRYVFVNHADPKVKEQLIGKATPFDFVDTRHQDAMRESFQTTFATGQATTYEAYVPQLDAWYSNIVGPIYDQGIVTSLSILTREITKAKHAEEELLLSERRMREAHKLQSLGTLAGGIAHDLNNILTPVLGYTEMLSAAQDQDRTSYLEGIRLAAERARDLVQRILLFARRREPKKVVLDIGKMVSDGVKFIQASAPASILIEVDLPPEPIYVFADRTQLDQVLINLATNALQAMKDRKGRLSISVRTIAVTELQGVPNQVHESTRWMQLSVCDSGPGMDEETQRRAFEPFFTTKDVGSGTGLGLSIVHGIVTEHGGAVTIASTPGAGAIFNVSLPTVLPDKAEENSGAPELPTLHVGPLRVLCVDDEPSLIRLVSETLKRRGHIVTAFTDARDAFDQLRRNPHAFDVFITDQTMPHMLGTELIRELRAINPTMPCVLMTGFCTEDVMQPALAMGHCQLLPKPFSIKALSNSIDHAVRSSRK